MTRPLDDHAQHGEQFTVCFGATPEWDAQVASILFMAPVDRLLCFAKLFQFRFRV